MLARVVLSDDVSGLWFSDCFSLLSVIVVDAGWTGCQAPDESDLLLMGACTVDYWWFVGFGYVRTVCNDSGLLATSWSTELGNECWNDSNDIDVMAVGNAIACSWLVNALAWQWRWPYVTVARVAIIKIMDIAWLGLTTVIVTLLLCHCCCCLLGNSMVGLVCNGCLVTVVGSVIV